MSYPNSGQGQGGYAQGSSSNANGQAFNPALLNTSANTANFGNTTNTSSVPAPPMSLNPAQLQSLTDFHRQQQQQSQQAQAQQQQQRPPTSQSGIFLPEHVRQAMSTLTGTAKETFMKEYFKTDEGRRLLQLYNQDQQRQQAVLRAQQSSSSPMRTSSDLPPDSPPRQSMMSASMGTGTGAGGSGGGSNRPHPGTPTPVQPKPLMPITKAFDPSSFTRPTPSTQSQVVNSNRIAPSNQASSSQPPSNPASTSQPPSLSQADRNQSSVAFWHSQNPPSYTPYRRPPSPEYGRGSSGPSRRNEGMRGTMRSELARLMYASGDVENPDVDTIDYMEDLVVDWLADLCAPPPPVRAHDKAPLLTPRLDYNIIRHRLSRPSMRKYLDRFEYMEYKAVDMRSARRVAKGNFEPVDQKDLDGQLEKGFLDGEDAGGGGGGGEGDNRKKRKYKRQPQQPQSQSNPQGQGQGQAGEGEEGQGKERKKPGPKKGWKRGERKNTAGPGGGGSSSAPSVRGGSIKPEE